MKNSSDSVKKRDEKKIVDIFYSLLFITFLLAFLVSFYYFLANPKSSQLFPQELLKKICSD